MRKFILTMLCMLFVSLGTYAQPKMTFDFSEYSNTDSLEIEMVYFHTNQELNKDNFFDLGGGYYMVKTPFKSHFVIKTNSDKTKAIVTNKFHFDPFQYTYKEDDRRITLYYKDNKVCRGYVYDKKLKVCQPFDSNKGYKKFIRRHDRFIRRNQTHRP